MKLYLQSAITNFKKRAKQSGQVGKNLSKKELEILSKKLQIEFPDWYKELMLSASILGIGFSIKEFEEEDDLSSMAISSYKDILSEMVDGYPGMKVIKWGFINFGACDIGTGDQFFINLRDGENPPVYRVYHDAAFETGIVENKNAHQVAVSISSLLRRAVFDGFH